MRATEPIKAKRICVGILGAGFDTGNLGVGALTCGAMKCILAQYPDAELFLMDYGKRSSKHTVTIEGREVVVPTVNMRFSWKVFLPNNIAFLLAIALVLRATPSCRLRRWILARSICLSCVADADFLTAISGGDSFSDIYGLIRLLYVALPQFLALLMGKRLILLPQTFGPFKTRLAQVIAGAIIRRADHAYSRDWAGLKLLEATLGPAQASKASFCYDVGFVLDPCHPQELDCQGFSPDALHQGPLVGINVSGLLYMGGYNRRNMFGLELDYPDLVESLIEFLIVKRHASVLLVPHVMSEGTDAEGDTHVCLRIYQKLTAHYGDRLGSVRGAHNQNEIKAIIGQCDFFIGSRMHACIAAVSQHVPAVSIAYSDKFIGVMETIGIGGMVADARRMTASEVITAVGEAFDRRAIIHGQLLAKMPSVQKAVLELLSGVIPKEEERQEKQETRYESSQASAVTAEQA